MGRVSEVGLLSTKLVAKGEEITIPNAVLVGTPTTYPPGSGYERNKCSISGLANPDNLAFVDGYATLVVGEDSTTGHQNDVLWAWDLREGRLDRILTGPYGAETTSPYWYGDRGGHGYLMGVVQHPFAQSDRDQLQDPSELAGSVGYIGPFPATNP